MNTEPITLSPEHSARLHALHHVAGFMSMDELIEELIFAYNPDNTLDTMARGLEGSPRRRLESLASPLNGKPFEDWDDLVVRSEYTPPYDPADYPEPDHTPTNIVQFEVIK